MSKTVEENETVTSENQGQNASLRSRRCSIGYFAVACCTTNEKPHETKPAVLKPAVVCEFRAI